MKKIISHIKEHRDMLSSIFQLDGFVSPLQKNEYPSDKSTPDEWSWGYSMIGQRDTR